MGHFDRLMQFDPLLATRKILDLGCGQGALAIEAAERGADVVGVDIEIEGARKQAAEAGVTARFLQ